MAKRRKKRKLEEETLVDIVEVKESAQSFIEQNQIAIIAGASILVLLVGGFLSYTFLYQAPRETEAKEQIFRAEYQYMRDSFALALENPGGGYEGLLDIIDNYSGTKTANLAMYYAGTAYLNLGRFEDAISYLESHNPKSLTKITTYGALGDAYSELGDMDSAIDNYQKAANSDNEALTPYYLNKLGLLYNRQGDKDKALASFERIKEDFPESPLAVTIDKYIGMLK